VVKDYEEVAQHLRSAKGWAEWWKVSSLGIGVVQDALRSILTSDERDIAVALEDLSRELLYGTSLSRLGDSMSTPSAPPRKRWRARVTQLHGGTPRGQLRVGRGEGAGVGA
jgi:hypothetical protein